MKTKIMHCIVELNICRLFALAVTKHQGTLFSIMGNALKHVNKSFKISLTFITARFRTFKPYGFVVQKVKLFLIVLAYLHWKLISRTLNVQGIASAFQVAAQTSSLLNRRQMFAAVPHRLRVKMRNKIWPTLEIRIYFANLIFLSKLQV